MTSPGRVFLQHLQSSFVKRICVPGRLSEKSIPARLVSTDRELPLRSIHCFLLGDHQACEILHGVLPLRVVSTFPSAPCWASVDQLILSRP